MKPQVHLCLGLRILRGKEGDPVEEGQVFPPLRNSGSVGARIYFELGPEALIHKRALCLAWCIYRDGSDSYAKIGQQNLPMPGRQFGL
jgi:hypothetical protein